MNAKVYAFPSARHIGMVETVARRMAECASVDEAQAELVAHLEIHWDRLEAFGVDCDAIDLECQLFAKAAWRGFQKVQQETRSA